MKNVVVSVAMDNRDLDAGYIQEIFTRHSSSIKVRLGVNNSEVCSGKGLILLVATGEENTVNKFIKDLEDCPRVIVKTMDI